MIETELTTNWIWLNAEIETTYQTDVREEECHGIHTFFDSEIVSCDVVKVLIRTKKVDIDITNRLTKEELEHLKIPFEAEPE
jgi:hypothetical protein